MITSDAESAQIKDDECLQTSAHRKLCKRKPRSVKDPAKQCGMSSSEDK